MEEECLSWVICYLSLTVHVSSPLPTTSRTAHLRLRLLTYKAEEASRLTRAWWRWWRKWSWRQPWCGPLKLYNSSSLTCSAETFNSDRLRLRGHSPSGRRVRDSTHHRRSLPLFSSVCQSEPADLKRHAGRAAIVWFSSSSSFISVLSSSSIPRRLLPEQLRTSLDIVSENPYGRARDEKTSHTRWDNDPPSARVIDQDEDTRLRMKRVSTVNTTRRFINEDETESQRRFRWFF